MSNLSTLLLFLTSILAGTVYLSQSLGIILPIWINSYVNDFLCLPIVLGYEQVFFRWLSGRKDYKFSIPFILSMAAYYSFYFEYYLPQQHERYTGDPVDVILYFLSTVCFYILNRMPARSISIKKISRARNT